MAKPNLPGRTYEISKCCDCGQGMNQVGNRKRCSPCADKHTVEAKRLRETAKRALARQTKMEKASVNQASH